MSQFQFQLDEQRCTGCGLCTRVCSTSILSVKNGKAVLEDVGGRFGWDGCFRCQHCLAVCPQGAISIFGKNPADSLPPREAADARQLDALITNRRSHRRFLDKPVEREIIDGILKILENSPTGSGYRFLEYTVLDDMERCRAFEKLAFEAAEQKAAEGVFPPGFSAGDFEKMRKWAVLRNPGDYLFNSAPHLLIVHCPASRKSWQIDCDIASTYFELLCASRGLGCVIMSLPVKVLAYLPEVRALLEIPEDHEYACVLGFGYPEIQYARGVQKDGIAKIHRPKLDIL